MTEDKLPVSLYFCFCLAKIMVEKGKTVKDFRSVGISPDYIKHLFEERERTPPDEGFLKKAGKMLDLEEEEKKLLGQMLHAWVRFSSEAMVPRPRQDQDWQKEILGRHNFARSEYKKILNDLADGRSVIKSVPAGSLPKSARLSVFDDSYGYLPKKICHMQEVASFGRDGPVEVEKSGPVHPKARKHVARANNGDLPIKPVADMPTVFMPTSSILAGSDGSEKAEDVGDDRDFNIQPAMVSGGPNGQASKSVQVDVSGPEISEAEDPMEEEVLTLGGLVRSAREARNIKQEKLAKLINRGLWFVRSMEEDSLKPPRSLVKSLSSALRLTSEQIELVNQLII